jgi:hypothetical protein
MMGATSIQPFDWEMVWISEQVVVGEHSKRKDVFWERGRVWISSGASLLSDLPQVTDAM